MDRIDLNLVESQAEDLAAALDIYARIGIGQLEEIGQMLRMGQLSLSKPMTFRENMREIEAIEARLSVAKACIGQNENGSYGIGHNHVALVVKRAWEVCKVLRKAIAEAKRPDVGSIERISNINFDGLLVRYTDDPAPRAVLGESQNSGFTIDLSLNFLQMKSALNALRLYTGLYHGNAGRIAEMVEIGQLQPRCVISGARVEMAADKAEMFHAALSSISDKIGVNQSAAAGPGSLLSALTAALREHDVAWLSVSDDDLQEDDALLAAEPLVAKFEAPDFS